MFSRLSLPFSGLQDELNHCIRYVSGTPVASVTTVAGSGSGHHEDGYGLSASFAWMTSIVSDGEGGLWIGQSGAIRHMDRYHYITTVCGNGHIVNQGIDGIGDDARIGIVEGLIADAANNLFISEDDRIRQLIPYTPLLINTATALLQPLLLLDLIPIVMSYLPHHCMFLGPLCCCVDALYFVDFTIDCCWLGIDQCRTILSRSECSFAVVDPRGLALTKDGHLLFADCSNHCIRRITLPHGQPIGIMTHQPSSLSTLPSSSSSSSLSLNRKRSMPLSDHSLHNNDMEGHFRTSTSRSY
jgi:hypothetical protein